jgi:hypothetical protein
LIADLVLTPARNIDYVDSRGEDKKTLVYPPRPQASSYPLKTIDVAGHFALAAV